MHLSHVQVAQRKAQQCHDYRVCVRAHFSCCFWCTLCLNLADLDPDILHGLYLLKYGFSATESDMKHIEQEVSCGIGGYGSLCLCSSFEEIAIVCVWLWFKRCNRCKINLTASPVSYLLSDVQARTSLYVMIKCLKNRVNVFLCCTILLFTFATQSSTSLLICTFAQGCRMQFADSYRQSFRTSQLWTWSCFEFAFTSLPGRDYFMASLSHWVHRTRWETGSAIQNYKRFEKRFASV